MLYEFCLNEYNIYIDAETGELRDRDFMSLIQTLHCKDDTDIWVGNLHLTGAITKTKSMTIQVAYKLYLVTVISDEDADRVLLVSNDLKTSEQKTIEAVTIEKYWSNNVAETEFTFEYFYKVGKTYIISIAGWSSPLYRTVLGINEDGVLQFVNCFYSELLKYKKAIFGGESILSRLRLAGYMA